MTIFITLEEVITAHYFMMKRMNDTDQAGVKERGLLESAVYRPQQSLFGEDAYPTLFAKAAALLDSLVRNPCFHKGNKRTAYLVTKAFLKLNGQHLRLERTYAVEIVVAIAQGIYSLEQIASILEEHSE